MEKSGQYKVKKGDKWTTLAKKFNQSVKAIAEHNNRSVHSRLKANEIIEIPLPKDEKLLIDVQKEMPKFSELNKNLIKDASFRKAFLKNPNAVLKKAGIVVEKDLLPRDFPVLRLMDDKKFQNLARKGDNAEIRRYLSEKYPGLVPPELMGPAHVADCVEAVAIALPAVAVADPII